MNQNNCLWSHRPFLVPPKNVWVYTFFMTRSEDHPPRSCAYLSGIRSSAITDALRCRRSWNVMWGRSCCSKRDNPTHVNCMSAQGDQGSSGFFPVDILVNQCLNIIRDVMLTQTGFRFAAFLYRWSLSDINDNTVQGNVPVRDISNADSTDLRHRVAEPAGRRHGSSISVSLMISSTVFAGIRLLTFLGILGSLTS